MEEIAVSKFKATCLSVLKRVSQTRKPIRVTRFGKPIAEIVPPAPLKRPKNWLGSMAGTVQILGDIVGPTDDLAGWDALDE